MLLILVVLVVLSVIVSGLLRPDGHGGPRPANGRSSACCWPGGHQ